METIAILGFGASGLSFLTQFIEAIENSKIRPNCKIIIFEDQIEQLAKGKAYKDLHPSMLLNSSVYFSRIGTNANEFHTWVLENHLNFIPEFGDLSNSTLESFLPRKIFGLYAFAKFQKALKIAARVGVEIITIADQVIDIKQSPNQCMVFTSDMRNFKVDKIIFSTGHKEKKCPFELSKYEHFFPSPYKIHADLPHFKDQERVLVVGTRLSGIDAAILLSQKKLKITMASRTGLMPMVKRCDKELVFPKYSKLDYLKTLNKLDSTSVFEHIKLDLNLKYQNIKLVDTLIHPLLPPTANFVQSIELAKNSILHWQEIFTPYDDYFDSLWANMKSSEQSNFLRDYFPVITRFTTSFPLENAIKMEKLLNDGYLFVRGGLQAIHQSDEKFVAIYSDGEKEIYDYVVCALGYDHNLDHQPLYANLRSKHMISYNAFDGLSVDMNTMEVKDHQFAIPIFALGSPIFGTRIFTNVLLKNAQDATKIVHVILSKFKT